MTSKDYKIIARAIYLSDNTKESVINQLITALQQDNYRFDAERFYEACMMEA